MGVAIRNKGVGGRFKGVRIEIKGFCSKITGLGFGITGFAKKSFKIAKNRLSPPFSCIGKECRNNCNPAFHCKNLN